MLGKQGAHPVAVALTVKRRAALGGLGLCQVKKRLLLLGPYGIDGHVDVRPGDAAPRALEPVGQVGFIIHELDGDVPVPVHVQKRHGGVVPVAELLHARHRLTEDRAERGLDGAGVGNRDGHAVGTDLARNALQPADQPGRNLLKAARAGGLKRPRRLAPGPVLLRELVGDVAPGHVLPDAGRHLTQRDARVNRQAALLRDGVDRHDRAVGIAGIQLINMNPLEAAAQHLTLLIALVRDQRVHVGLCAPAGIALRLAVSHQINLSHNVPLSFNKLLIFRLNKQAFAQDMMVLA